MVTYLKKRSHWLQEKVNTRDPTFLRQQILQGHIQHGKNYSVNTHIKFVDPCLQKSQRGIRKEWEWFILIPAFYFCPLITSGKPLNEPEPFILFPIAIRHGKNPRHNSFQMLNCRNLDIQYFLHSSSGS